MQKKDDELEFFFKKISVRVNKSPDDFEPFIRILRDNWYDTPESLLGLTDSDYEKMKIPHRVVAAIRVELIAEPSLNKKNPKPQQSQNRPASNERPHKVTLDQNIMSQLANQLQTGLLQKYNKQKHQILPILQIMYKIISNILKDPYQIKYRTLKKSNGTINKTIIQNKPCVQFFTAIGFQDKSETLQMHIVEVHHLHFIQDCLDDLIQRFGGRKSHSQPQSHQKQEQMFLNITEFPKNQSQISERFSEDKLAEMKYVDALDKLIEFRNKLMSEPPKNRRIRIYHKKYEKKNVQIQEVNFSEEFSKSDDQIIAGYWKQAMANNAKSQKFQSKRKLEFEYLLKQKVHKEALIKIKMPNEYIIQGYFGPLETLQAVFDVVSKIIIGDLYLFTAPPPKRMDAKQLKMTLIELQSVPMGSFYVGINSEYYIDKSYVPIIEK